MFKGYIYSKNNKLNEQAKEKANEFITKILDTKVGNYLTDYEFEEVQDNEVYIFHSESEQPIFSIFLGSVEENTKPYYSVEDGSLEEFDDVQILFENLDDNLEDIISEISECLEYMSYDDEEEDEDEDDDYDEEW